MIVSTVPIPYENIDYIMVSPLLNEEDANQVKQYIKRKIPLILEKNRSPKEEVQQVDVPDMLKAAESMGRYMAVIQDVLRHFTLTHLKTNLDHSLLLLELFQQLKKDGLIVIRKKRRFAWQNGRNKGDWESRGRTWRFIISKMMKSSCLFSKCMISAPLMK